MAYQSHDLTSILKPNAGVAPGLYLPPNQRKGDKVAHKPNDTDHIESTDSGKYAVYVFFTKAELQRIQKHCNKSRKHMGRGMADLIRDELMLEEQTAED